MKMNKILAAGVAASLAVTSLAAVASAAERTFPMKYTTAEYTYKANAKGVAEDLDSKVFGLESYLPQAAVEANFDTNVDGKKDFNDFDEFLPVDVTFTDADLENYAKLAVTISGQKKDEKGNVYSVVEKTTLIRMDVFSDAGKTTKIANYVLPIYATSAPTGSFMPGDFGSVDSIKIDVDGIDSVTVYGVTEAEWNELEANKGKSTADVLKATSASSKDTAFKILDASTTAATITIKTKGVTADETYAVVADVTKDTNGVMQIVATTKAQTMQWNAATKTWDAAATNTDKLRQEIATLIGTTGITVNWVEDSGKTTDNEAWLPVTDYNGNKTIERMEVIELATTGAHGSTSTSTGTKYSDLSNQSYDEVEYNKGKLPNGFAGLASQIADFFNKQLNGTITFNFAAGDTTNGSGWLNGGIPSTEVGIKNSMKNMTNNDIALFVNYGSTTGSLQAATEVKADELKVTFDISEILDALGGQTIGVVQDIYYGMVKGAKYGDKEGFKVESVTLAYDEDADDGDIVDGDEDDGDVDVDTDEDEGDVDTDEDEGDGEVDGDTDEDLPTEGDEAGEDENPGTGVALAVVPAIMAAAAVVVSKKRK